MKKIIYHFSFVLLLFFGTKTHAWSEYIKSFHSDITVNKDSSLDITETIVYVTKDKRTRGLFRDFPTRYSRDLIFIKKVGFNLLEVLKNDKPEPFITKSVEGGKRIRIGQEHVYLPYPATYVYTIRYKTDRQLKFFETFDELHWNVNGTLWRLPIAKVSATVHLPEGIAKENVALRAVTGRWGQEGDSYTAFFDENSNLVFASTRVFAPKEGLTITVSWPKGFVTVPTESEEFWWLVKDNYVQFSVFLLFFILIIFSIISYIRFRRTQDLGVVIPLFRPPDGLNPADVRYISKIRYDSKVFAAEIVDMAVKGLLSIKQESSFWKNVYVLERKEGIEKKIDQHRYKSLFYDLFGSGISDSLFKKRRSSITLDRSNRSIIRKAVKSLKKQLKQQFNKKYFSSVLTYSVIGGALVVPALVMLIVTGAMEEMPIFASFAFWIIAAFFRLFLYLLRGYTKEGLRIKNEIEGFKLFLSTTEEDRLKVIGTPPTKTPQLYETYLPYAIALGVEKQWTKKFASVFKNLEEDGTPYVPIWYAGLGGFSSSTFASGLSRSVNTSSGSKGGSGSGGGGGGGGSW